MRYLVSATAHFDSSHRLAGDGPCSKLHGHRWRVEAEIAGEMGPRRIPDDERLGLLIDLGVLSDEFHGRDLNEMLPAAPPTAENIAIQFMERLRFRWPRITRVTVAQDEATSVSIENEAVP